MRLTLLALLVILSCTPVSDPAPPPDNAVTAAPGVTGNGSGAIDASSTGLDESSGDVTSPTPPAPGITNAREPVDSPLLRRIAVLGASASAGFGLERETGGVPVNLTHMLDVAILGAHETPTSRSSAFFFMNPRQNGEAYVELALEDEPTVVIALDFLFWFTYGVYANEDARLHFLERGLALLDEFECTVLTSEVPLMAEAVGKMLLPMQVPHEHTLEAANQRIREWAEERADVHLVPLVGFLSDLKKGRVVRIRDHEWPAGAIQQLLQVDELHPTMEGLAGLALLSLDTLVRDGRLDPAAVRWDPKEIATTVHERVVVGDADGT